MEITETLKVKDRDEWRKWLSKNHAKVKEIWLLYPRGEKAEDKEGVSYLDAVEEALCFGWIDGIAKVQDEDYRAQRFTPRTKKSHWTELNKDRVRRLIAEGRMTKAGEAVLPDLDEKAFKIPKDIEDALKEDPQVWENFQNFPDHYKRIRISFIEEQRKKPDVFKTRLENFIKKTAQNKMFGTMR